MRWRLIPYAESDGPWNMAVDEAILESFIAGDSPPTLRFYGWEHPWVTIGRLQPISSVPEGWGTNIVRRPTGGRAVRHGADLTFSLVLSSQSLGSPIQASYRRTSEAVYQALQHLGLAAQTFRNTTPAASVRGIGDCFDLTLEYELAVDGKKALGSAQVRRSGAVLQQNSLALPPCGVDREALVRVIATSMAREFDVEIDSAQLSEKELEITRRIADNKYTCGLHCN